MTDTERIEKAAFAIAERVAREVARDAIALHVSQCGVPSVLEKLEHRMGAQHTSLLSTLKSLTQSVTDMDRKLLGGDYEFKDVDRRLEAVEEANAETRKRVDAYDAHLRVWAIKILFGGSALAAAAVALSKVVH